MSAEAPSFTPARPAMTPIPPHRSAMPGPHRRVAATSSPLNAPVEQAVAAGSTTLSVKQTGPHSRQVNSVATSVPSAPASAAMSTRSDASRLRESVIAPPQPEAPARTGTPASRDASVVQPRGEKAMEQKVVHEDPFTVAPKTNENIAPVSNRVDVVGANYVCETLCALPSLTNIHSSPLPTPTVPLAATLVANGFPCFLN